LFNIYTNRIPLFGYSYLEYLLLKNLKKLESFPDTLIVHVLYQVSYYYRIIKMIRILNNKLNKDIHIVFTVHDIFDRSGNVDNSIYNKIRDVDVIFVPSKYTAETLKMRFSINAPIHVTYNPVDPIFKPLPAELKTTLRENFLRQHNLPKDSYLLLYVGTEKPSKNIEGLFKVLSISKESLENVYLIKVGKPGRRDHLIKYAHELNISKNIIWINNVIDSDLMKLYNISNVFITLSL
ncbi:glycosyltransferase, partial [Thermococcus sp. GR7]|nr:glycosyltransferase [Thermococcus sp. GR7]